MADTTTQGEVEDWIRQEWMPERFGQAFRETNVTLTSGGPFKFDAVSADGSIVANVSTSTLKTRGGNRGSGKVNKVRSDIYFLLLARAPCRLMVLSEADMYQWWLNEEQRGRVPAEIEFVHVEIPPTLDANLRASRKAASREVSPGD